MVQGEAERPFHLPPTWEGLVLGLFETRTDGAGRFRFDGLGTGTFELSTVQLHAGVPRRQAWLVKSGDPDLLLRLDPAGFEDMVFEGRAFDALTGLPVREFTLTLLGRFPGLEGNACAFNSQPIPVHDEDGRYRIGGFAPMESGLFVKAAGYRDQGFVPTERGAGVHHQDLELFPVRSLAVRVLDASGAPLRATLIVADRDGHTIWVPASARALVGSLGTDGRGEALLQNLPAAKVTVQVFLGPGERARLPEGRAHYQVFDVDLERPLEEVLVLRTEFAFAD